MPNPDVNAKSDCFLTFRQVRCESYVCHTLRLRTQKATLLRSKEHIASIAPGTVANLLTNLRLTSFLMNIL